MRCLKQFLDVAASAHVFTQGRQGKEADAETKMEDSCQPSCFSGDLDKVFLHSVTL